MWIRLKVTGMMKLAIQIEECCMSSLDGRFESSCTDDGRNIIME